MKRDHWNRAGAGLLPVLVVWMLLGAGGAAAGEVRGAAGWALRSAPADPGGPSRLVPSRRRGVPVEALAPNAVSRFLVHTPGDPGALRRRLVARGVRVEAYLSRGVFLVTATGDEIRRLWDGGEGLEVDWIEPYHPFLRLSPEVRDLAADFGEVGVVLHLFHGSDRERVAAQLRTLGVEAAFAAGPTFLRAGFRTPVEHLVAIRGDLARMDEVFWVELRGEVRLFNADAVPIVQSGSVDQGRVLAERGLDGTGQVIAVLDTGLELDSCYFRDEAGWPPVNLAGEVMVNSSLRKVIAYDFLDPTEDPADPLAYDTLGHGTHVAGNAGGAAVGDGSGAAAENGMAPGVRFVVQDGGYGVDDCADLPALGCPLLDLTPFLAQAYQQGARIHTNSWGDNENASIQNTYSATSEDVDAFVWAHPDLVVVFAAGNAGPAPGTVASPSTAKNAISVGGTWNGEGLNVVYALSGRGPTSDGRIKPDVMAPANTTSAGGDGNVETGDCMQDRGVGTSFSAPLVAGAAALVRQYFVEGFHACGAPCPAQGFEPSAALVKAVIINSAERMTLGGALPGEDQGWGRVALSQALAFPDSGFQLHVVDGTVAFETSSDPPFGLELTLGESRTPFKVTLVWTDPPSTPAAAVNLVNDLDLSVSCGTRTYRGNVFSAGKSVPGGRPDRVNNVEQVYLPTPRAGRCRVEVAPGTIVDGPQRFALVIRGDVS